MKKLFTSLLVVFCTLLSSQDLSIYTEETGNASYLEKDGMLTGSSVEIVREIQKRVGNNSKIEVLPWARGYIYAQKNPNTILFSMTRTPERETMFKWVGPILSVKWIFYAKADGALKINSLDDAKKVTRIGTVRSDAREDFLKNEGFTNLDAVTNNELNVKKLMIGRIDLFVSTNLGVAKTAEDAGHRVDELDAVYSFKEAELYIAFSQKTDDAIVEKWKKALDEMKKDGTFKKIYKKWYPKEKIK